MATKAQLTSHLVVSQDNALASTTQCGDCFLGFVQRGPGCNKDACYNHVENPLVEILTSGEIAEDVLSIQSINESFPGIRTELYI